MKNKSSMSNEEQEIMRLLTSAFNKYVLLTGNRHPSDNNDFCNGIHDCQKVLGLRILRREFPNEWYGN